MAPRDSDILCLANILRIAGRRVRFNTRSEGNVGSPAVWMILIARNASQSLPMAASDSESNGLRPRISSFAEMDFFNVGTTTHTPPAQVDSPRSRRILASAETCAAAKLMRCDTPAQRRRLERRRPIDPSPLTGSVPFVA
jgi:hypothetical protein